MIRNVLSSLPSVMSKPSCSYLSHNAVGAPHTFLNGVKSAGSPSLPSARTNMRMFSIASSNQINPNQQNLNHKKPLLTALNAWGVEPSMSNLALERVSKARALLAERGVTIDEVSVEERMTTPSASGLQTREIRISLSDVADQGEGLSEITVKNAEIQGESQSEMQKDGRVIQRVVSFDMRHADDGQTARVVRVSNPEEGAITKGGIRVLPYSGHQPHSKAALQEGAAELSRGMTEKTKCVGLNHADQRLGFKLAGGKTEVSMPESWEGTQKKADLFAAQGLVAPITLALGMYDSPAPDMRSGPKEMDAYAASLKDQGVEKPGFWITGKGAEGAHPFRPQATGEGVAEVLRQMLNMKGAPVTMQSANIAVQGAGNVGLFTLRSLLENDEAKIVALSDMKGALHIAQGLTMANLDDAINVVKGEMAIEAFNAAHGTQATLADSNAIWSMGANVWIPAANKDSITLEHLQAERSAPLMIVCGANNALTDETIQQLGQVTLDQPVYIAPPEIANPGGVVGSALEMEACRQEVDWDAQEGQAYLEDDKIAFRSKMQSMFLNILGDDIEALKNANGYQARNEYVAHESGVEAGATAKPAEAFGVGINLSELI